MDDDDKLLNLAKGLDPKTYWLIIPEKKKEYITKRREARRTIFKIRKFLNAGKELEGDRMLSLHAIMFEQLDPNLGLSYTTFSTAWDIHPKSFTKMILKEHWIREGGGFDKELGTPYPTAFTNQEE